MANPHESSATLRGRDSSDAENNNDRASRSDPNAMGATMAPIAIQTASKASGWADDHDSVILRDPVEASAGRNARAANFHGGTRRG